MLALTLPLIAVFDFQRLTPIPLSQTKSASQAVSITYQYTASAAGTNGLGVRIHFDSSRLTYNQMSSLFVPPGNVGPMFIMGPSDPPQADTNNQDGDTSTDQVILVAWAHTETGFPGALPTNLFTVEFTTNAVFTAATRVNISAIATSEGYEFQGSSSLISPPGAATPTPLAPTPTPTPNPGGDTATIDVDASGAVGPFSDGLLILKYLIGLRGANLVSGNLISANCTPPQCDATGIGAYIEFIRPQLDVDGNGSATPFSDGLLILKYLIGLRDANLISGNLIGAGCTPPKCDADGIEIYIEDLRTP